MDGLGTVLLCHGGPASDMTIVTLVTPDERLARIVEGVDGGVVVAGHTHSQIDRTVAGVRWVNAGSVGMPYEAEQGAYWALLGPGRRATPDAVRRGGRRAADPRGSGYPDAETSSRTTLLSPPRDRRARPLERRTVRQGAAPPTQDANSEK